jgi:hypothetical protein
LQAFIALFTWPAWVPAVELLMNVPAVELVHESEPLPPLNAVTEVLLDVLLRTVLFPAAPTAVAVMLITPEPVVTLVTAVFVALLHR